MREKAAAVELSGQELGGSIVVNGGNVDLSLGEHLDDKGKIVLHNRSHSSSRDRNIIIFIRLCGIVANKNDTERDRGRRGSNLEFLRPQDHSSVVATDPQST